MREANGKRHFNELFSVVSEKVTFPSKNIYKEKAIPLNRHVKAQIKRNEHVNQHVYSSSLGVDFFFRFGQSLKIHTSPNIDKLPNGEKN